LKLPRTPSQTVGPYFAIGLCRRAENVLDPDGRGLSGTLIDGAGDPIPDGVIELWDRDARLWGRCGTDPGGRFSFRIRGDARALDGYVFARGLLKHQRFRIDLEDLGPDGDELTFDVRMQGEDATPFYEQ
jgi:protocatechuate 3,4-dioxygenase, alpha subunit